MVVDVESSHRDLRTKPSHTFNTRGRPATGVLYVDDLSPPNYYCSLPSRRYGAVDSPTEFLSASLTQMQHGFPNSFFNIWPLRKWQRQRYEAVSDDPSNSFDNSMRQTSTQAGFQHKSSEIKKAQLMLCWSGLLNAVLCAALIALYLSAQGGYPRSAYFVPSCQYPLIIQNPSCYYYLLDVQTNISSSQRYNFQELNSQKQS